MTAGALGSLLALLLLAPDDADRAFLAQRADDLRELYGELAGNQDAAGVRKRRLVVRELGHLPWRGASRREAGKLLARIVAGDRSFGVRAAAARAIGRVGTAPALDALYRGLFGPDARTGRFEHLGHVLPDAVARIDRAGDLAWIARHVLQPAATKKGSAVLRAAGPLRDRAVAATLRGLGDAGAHVVVPEILTLARVPRVAVRVAALRALGAIGHWDPLFEEAAEDALVAVRAAAAAHPGIPLYLSDRLRGDDATAVRRAAVDGLAKRVAKEAVPRLVEQLARDPSGALRLDIAERLAGLTGKDFGRDATLWRLWWEAQETGPNNEPREPADTGRVYFFGVGFRAERVLFVVDTSGSMAREDARGRSRLRRAAAELDKAVRALASTARFRVLAFNSALKEFPDRTRPRSYETPAFAEKAAAWLARTRPAGATNTYAALMEALRSDFAPDTIVLLSDGRPYRCSWKGKTYDHAEQILAEVARANPYRAVRIHTVALLDGAARADPNEDEAAAADFLRRLAAENRGTFRELR